MLNLWRQKPLAKSSSHNLHPVRAEVGQMGSRFGALLDEKKFTLTPVKMKTTEILVSSKSISAATLPSIFTAPNVRSSKWEVEELDWRHWEHMLKQERRPEASLLLQLVCDETGSWPNTEDERGDNMGLLDETINWINYSRATLMTPLSHLVVRLKAIAKSSFIDTLPWGLCELMDGSLRIIWAGRRDNFLDSAYILADSLQSFPSVLDNNKSNASWHLDILERVV